MKTIFYGIVIYPARNFQLECSTLSVIKNFRQYIQRGVWIDCDDNATETEKTTIDVVVQKYAVKLGMNAEQAAQFIPFDEDRTGHIKTS